MYVHDALGSLYGASYYRVLRETCIQSSIIILSRITTIIKKDWTTPNKKASLRMSVARYVYAWFSFCICSVKKTGLVLQGCLYLTVDICLTVTLCFTRNTRINKTSSTWFLILRNLHYNARRIMVATQKFATRLNILNRLFEKICPLYCGFELLNP